MVKKCSRCQIVKDELQYPKDKRRSHGLNPECNECMCLKAKECRLRNRWKVLNHYGGDSPVCACANCHEKNFEFLTVDHINGDGAEHRRTVKHIYTWLIKNRFPFGFQVLCMNCNLARGVYGYCPHDGIHSITHPPQIRKNGTGSIGIEKARLIKQMLKTLSINAVAKATKTTRPTVRKIHRGLTWVEA
jgi:hypothetical protein